MKLFQAAGMMGQNQIVCVCDEDCAEQTAAIKRAVQNRVRFRIVMSLVIEDAGKSAKSHCCSFFRTISGSGTARKTEHLLLGLGAHAKVDRKSTRLNSSHLG